MKVNFAEKINKHGLKVKVVASVEMSNEEYQEMDDQYTGVCMACGEEATGVEPDARGYECECCSAMRVYGLQELLLAGKVGIV